MIAAKKRGGIAVVLALGCGPVVDASADVASGDASTTGVPSPTTSGAGEHASVADEVTTVQPDPPPVTTADESTTTADTTASFVALDLIVEPIFCDIWKQDCPRGEKCMPWANDGGNVWNDTRCSPIADDPREVGESCTVVGSGVSGIDDCAFGAMCWNVDADTNMGECVAFCQGSEVNPTCEAPCHTCPIGGDSVLAICLPDCDPLAQECGDGLGCYATYQTFLCVWDASGDEGGLGTPCDYINGCDPGSACVEGSLVPGCEGPSCCAAFCDAGAVDECDAVMPGTTCTPWFEEGEEPGACIGEGTVGACLAEQ